MHSFKDLESYMCSSFPSYFSYLWSLYTTTCGVDNQGKDVLVHNSSPFKENKRTSKLHVGKNKNLLPLSHVYTSYMVIKACGKEETV